MAGLQANVLSFNKYPTKAKQAQIEGALETISIGIRELQEVGQGVAHVDVAARLNAQCNELKKLLEPIKDAIKAKGLQDNLETDSCVVYGVKYKACIKIISKSVLDTENVKLFLTKLKKLADFLVTRKETQVQFEVKE